MKHAKGTLADETVLWRVVTHRARDDAPRYVQALLREGTSW